MRVLAASQQSEHDIRFLFANQDDSATILSVHQRRQGLSLGRVGLDPGSSLRPPVGSRGFPTARGFNAGAQFVDAHFGRIHMAALRAWDQARLQPQTFTGCPGRPLSLLGVSLSKGHSLASDAVVQKKWHPKVPFFKCRAAPCD
jgi:hypothetical protein